jgi:hypothetical protein
MKYYELDEESLRDAELRTQVLLKALGDDWHAAHSLGWQDLDNLGRQRKGEVDFLLLHRSLGILVLEVKGGRISLENGQFFTTNRNNERIKIDPVSQAQKSFYYLRDLIAKRFGPNYLKSRNLKLNWAVIFPDGRFDVDLGAMGVKGQILSAADLTADRMEKKFRDLLGENQNKSGHQNEDEFQKLLNVFLPNGSMRPILDISILHATGELDQRRNRLVQVEATRLQNDFRSKASGKWKVQGSAGTGKTFLAIEQAAKYALNGFRVLYVCHTEGLRFWVDESLKLHFQRELTYAKTKPRVSVVKIADLPYAVSGKSLPDNLAKSARLSLRDVISTSPNVERYDFIVIDEGQDIEPDSLSLIRTLLAEPDSPMQVFFDENQSRYGRGWRFPFEDFNEHELIENCRNTNQVMKMAKDIGKSKAVASGVDGPEIRGYQFVRENLVSLVIRELYELNKTLALSPNQITVIRSNGNLRELKDSKELKMRFPKVKVTEVDKFKGLENEAVILCLTGKDVDKDDFLRQMYVGSSRPKGQLSLFLDREAVALLQENVGEKFVRKV